MTMLAPTLQSFFTSYLVNQRDASANTIIAYRDTWRLLLLYLRDVHHLAPERVDFEDLSTETITAFLAYLEATRTNSASTRNARLAAVHALFHHAALQLPEHASTIARVLAIMPKRTATPDISYLSESEVSALLAAPMLDRWAGRRDQLMVLTLVSTGLRVSELTATIWADVALGTPTYLRCHGKGRKDRTTPLSPEVRDALRAWREENVRLGEGDPVFPAQGTRRAMSSDAVALRLALHVRTAAQSCPSLSDKHVAPHVLRHTCAMRLLAAGVDVATIALWLGHESVESTRAYLHADLSIKQKALNRTAPLGVTPGNYQPPDTLIAFLENL